MFIRRLPFVLFLAVACTAKQDPEQAAPEKDTPQAAAEPQTPPPASGPSYALIPDQAIGPVRVGMSRAEVEALGFETHPQFSGMTIPITVYYDEADQAKTMEISLMHTDKDVTVDELTIPKGATVEQIRELLGDCQEPEINIGASIYPCRGGAVLIAIGSGNSDEVWLRTGVRSHHELIPNESIGRYRIGMSKDEIATLGLLMTHPQFSGMTIPISVGYDEGGKAEMIEISLSHSDKDVAIGDVTIPRTATVEQIRELLGDCLEPEVNRGATMHSCRGGTVFIAISSAKRSEVWLRINKP